MRIFVLLSLLPLLSGCLMSREALESPDTVHDVNRVLRRETATIIQANGEAIEEAKDTRVGPDVVEYFELKGYYGLERHTIPTSTVARIEVEVSLGRRIGTLVGASPGLLILGYGALVYPSTPSDSWDRFGAVIGVGAGAVFALGGALIGSVFGNAARPKETFVVYQGPYDLPEQATLIPRSTTPGPSTAIPPPP